MYLGARDMMFVASEMSCSLRTAGEPAGSMAEGELWHQTRE